MNQSNSHRVNWLMWWE